MPDAVYVELVSHVTIAGNSSLTIFNIAVLNLLNHLWPCPSVTCFVFVNAFLL